jgi:heparin binding hemagglutinin HbhA
MAENTNIEDLKAPLLAALGAADLALATVNELITTRSRVEESRARLTKLQEELPEHVTDLRERFTSDELRKAAEGYLDAATNRYNDLVERGEAALTRLRNQSGFDDASARAEGYVDQAVELTQEALGTVASSASVPPSWSASICRRRRMLRPRRPRRRWPRRLRPRRHRPRRLSPRRLRPRRSPRSSRPSTTPVGSGPPCG